MGKLVGVILACQRRIEGVGLHSGQEVSVTLAVVGGPLELEHDGIVRPLDAFHVSHGRFATSIACDAFELRTVEHYLAALAGLGIREGCRLSVAGASELPMLDGGAAEWVSCLRALALPSGGPRLRVARRGRIEVEGSTYDFDPQDATTVSVDVELPASCARLASWDGTRETFIREIAPARTFAVESDVAELTKLGLAHHVDPRSVLVVTPDAIHGQGHVAREEPARHKLLDLMGDACLYGGPPLGALRASRPGHARNHAAFARALETGVVEARA